MAVSESLKNNSLRFFSFKEKIGTTEDALGVGRLLIEGRRSFSFLFFFFFFLELFFFCTM